MSEHDAEFYGLTTLVNTSSPMEPVTIEGMLKAQADMKRLKQQLALSNYISLAPICPRRSGKTQELRDIEWRIKMMSNMFPPDLSPMYGLSAIMDIPGPRFMKLRRKLFLKTIGRKCLKK